MGQFRALLRDRRKLLLICGAAVVITVNWGGYIWGVNNGRVVETSLGYFINPLVTVLMGVLILGEHLRRLQWIAMGIAFVAVVVLTIDYGRPALGRARPRLLLRHLRPAQEAGRRRTPWRASRWRPWSSRRSQRRTSPGWSAPAQSTFGSQGAGHALLFTTTGIITAVPLMLFGAAAIRVSMVSLGLLQYLAPTIQFALGILVFDEAMPASRWIGFGLVWVALVIFTVEAVNHRRRQLRLVAHAQRRLSGRAPGR